MTLAECTLDSSILYPVRSGVSVVVPELAVPEPKLRYIDEIKKEFMKTIQKLSYSRHTWQVWQDFTELAALSIVQKVWFTNEREDQYLKTIGRYGHDEAQLFSNLLGLTIEALGVEYQDFLGQMFMELDMGNQWKGQFFTPYCICKLIAQMTFDLALFNEKPVVYVNEPAAGSGAMVIALCEFIRNNEIAFQERLRGVAQDVDSVTAYMCYIQLSLIGCPAHVIIGNTLTMECREKFVTPFAAMQGWLN